MSRNSVVKLFDQGFRGFDRVVGAISQGCGILGAVGISLLMLLITADVLGRAILNTTITGTPEIVRNTLPGIVFLLIPYAMRTGSHIRATIVLDRVPRILNRALVAVSYLVGLWLFAFITWATWEPAIESWRTGEFEGMGALRVPVYPVRIILVVTAILMCFECASALIKVLLGETRSEPGRGIE